MALWATKNMGVLFGGVTDEDTSEETLESVFHNDLYGYQISGNGRWTSMLLKKPKKVKVQQKKKAAGPVQTQRRGAAEEEEDDEGTHLGDDDATHLGDDDDYKDEDDVTKVRFFLTTGFSLCNGSHLQAHPSKSAARTQLAPPSKQPAQDQPPEDEVDPDDPILTIPRPRYNAMLAVLRNTLYMCVPRFL